MIPEMCPMPDKLQLLHEDSDRYALQTTEPCSLPGVSSASRMVRSSRRLLTIRPWLASPELEARMTAFMAKLKWITKDEYFRL